MAAVYVLELVVIMALVLLFDFFSFIGLVSLGISFLVAFFGIARFIFFFCSTVSADTTRTRHAHDTTRRDLGVATTEEK